MEAENEKLKGELEAVKAQLEALKNPEEVTLESLSLKLQFLMDDQASRFEGKLDDLLGEEGGPCVMDCKHEAFPVFGVLIFCILFPNSPGVIEQHNKIHNKIEVFCNKMHAIHRPGVFGVVYLHRWFPHAEPLYRRDH